jgi:hypothetical protein
VVNPARSRVLDRSFPHTTPNRNDTPDQTVANAVIATLSPTGTFCINTPTPTDIIIDLNGARAHT